MSLALALTLLGASGEALEAIDAALAVLEGVDAARAQMQRAVILQKLGRLDEALEGYRTAATALRRHGDTLWEARLLANRAVLQVYRGALRAAEADLRRAEALDRSLGQDLGATEDRHNLGWVAARRGDVPAALAAYDQAEEDYRRLGVPIALLLMDRCEVLLAARLVAEARRAAERAVAELAGRAAWRRTSPKRGSCSPTRTSWAATPRRGGSSRSRRSAPSPASTGRPGRRSPATRPCARAGSPGAPRRPTRAGPPRRSPAPGGRWRRSTRA